MPGALSPDDFVEALDEAMSGPKSPEEGFTFRGDEEYDTTPRQSAPADPRPEPEEPDTCLDFSTPVSHTPGLTVPDLPGDEAAFMVSTVDGSDISIPEADNDAFHEPVTGGHGQLLPFPGARRSAQPAAPEEDVAAEDVPQAQEDVAPQIGELELVSQGLDVEEASGAGETVEEAPVEEAAAAIVEEEFAEKSVAPEAEVAADPVAPVAGDAPDEAPAEEVAAFAEAEAAPELAGEAEFAAAFAGDAAGVAEPEVAPAVAAAAVAAPVAAAAAARPVAEYVVAPPHAAAGQGAAPAQEPERRKAPWAWAALLLGGVGVAALMMPRGEEPAQAPVLAQAVAPEETPVDLRAAPVAPPSVQIAVALPTAGTFDAVPELSAPQAVAARALVAPANPLQVSAEAEATPLPDFDAILGQRINYLPTTDIVASLSPIEDVPLVSLMAEETPAVQAVSVASAPPEIGAAALAADAATRSDAPASVAVERLEPALADAVEDAPQEPLPTLARDGAPAAASALEEPLIVAMAIDAAPAEDLSEGTPLPASLETLPVERWSQDAGIAAQDGAPAPFAGVETPRLELATAFAAQAPEAETALRADVPDAAPQADVSEPSPPPTRIAALPNAYWAPSLGFTLGPRGGAKGLEIRSVGEQGLPDWARGNGDGVVILAANGWSLASVDDLKATLAQTPVDAKTATGAVSLTIGGAGQEARVVEETLTFVRTNMTPGGTAFEAAFDGRRWRTRVVVAGTDTDLRIGDVIVRDFGTKKKFDYPTATEAVIDWAKETGAGTIEFAILRGEGIGTATLTTDGAPLERP